MNASKKINVNFSSLVGLKAELLRKQAEVNEAKMKSEVIHSIPKIKKKLRKPKEKNANEKSEKLVDIDDIKSHKKSRLMLEAKARLYERLKRSKRTNENFLVDFSNKSDESDDEPPKEEEEDIQDQSAIDDDDEAWVEYQDCFGRTRKCLREDLPMMRQKNEMLQQEVMNKQNNEAGNDEESVDKEAGNKKEPEIEIMRRKWEEQTEKLMDKQNIHYQDVLFDEARAHGVGYYGFSQDEEERGKQQEMLAKLRKETEQKQKEMKELRELKMKMEQNRLKAARIRQRIRAGLPAEPTEEELENKTTDNTQETLPEVSKAEDSHSEGIINDKGPEEESGQSENSEIAKENKIKALGELLGKRAHWYEMSQEEWVDKCRKVRTTEFGPVYENFKSAGYLDSKENAEQFTIDDQKQDSSNDACMSNSNVNEDDIIAGLRYLRKEFEKKQST